MMKTVKGKLYEFLVNAVTSVINKSYQNNLAMMRQSIREEISGFMMEDYNSMYNPYVILKQRAAVESVRYIEENMRDAVIIPMKNWGEKLKVLEYCLKRLKENSFIVECGVYSGTSINLIADRLPTSEIFGFDSFEGLPEDWSGYFLEKGTFKTQIPEVRPNITLIKGWFEDTLPDFVQDYRGRKIDLLHVDSDIYSSAATIFENLHSLLGEGSIIVFDEYFNYPNWKEHEYKAFQEFCSKHQVRYRYIVSGMHQVGIVIEKIADH